MSFISSLLSHLIPSSPAKGVETGFLYIDDAFKLIEWGVSAGNMQAVEDALAAAKQFESEFEQVMESAKAPVAFVVSLLLGGGDPFAASRQLVKAANATYQPLGFVPVAGL